MEGRPDRQMEPSDRSQLRISDDDRHRVADVLRQAAGEGRIDFEELDQRLEAAYAAKTYADLVPITSDLPAQQGQQPKAPVLRPPGAVVPAVSYTNSVAVMSDNTRRGVWTVPEQHTAFAMMGSVTLDLREAQFQVHEVTITAVAIMAGIDIIVNAQTVVIVEGFGLMGDFSEARSKVPADLSERSPVVRIKGVAMMAGVNVRRKGMPGETRKRIGWSK